MDLKAKLWPATTAYLRALPARFPLTTIVVVAVAAIVGLLLWSEARTRAEENSPEAIAARKQAEANAEISLLIDSAQMFVTTKLRDPASAEFSGLRVVRKQDQDGICGLVNARNGFGGRGGNEPFLYVDMRATLASEGPEARDVIRRFCG